MVDCSFFGVCSGCLFSHLSYAEQLEAKKQRFHKLWREAGLSELLLPAIEIQSLGEGGLRDRVEMTVFPENEALHFGLYDRERKHILDLDQCPMMSQRVRPLFQKFRQHLPQIPLGAVRLRVSPQGEYGVWCHFPNREIERLLLEADWIKEIQAFAHVEMGQRRLMPQLDGHHFQLVEGPLKPWFETYAGERAIPLYCHVGSFTQVGFDANRALVEMVLGFISQTEAHQWLELGAGIGNFTLALAAQGYRVTALENDRRAVEGLLRSRDEMGLAELIDVSIANMHGKQAFTQELTQIEGILADPPRSGLRSFVQAILAKPAPWMIYVSCSATSLIQDLAALTAETYKVEAVAGLDQFPQSEHCEWVVLLKQC